MIFVYYHVVLYCYDVHQQWSIVGLGKLSHRNIGKDNSWKGFTYMAYNKVWNCFFDHDLDLDLEKGQFVVNKWLLTFTHVYK